jgi:hypothetical protein
MGGNDLFLVVVRYAPLLFVIAGIVVVVWLSRQPLPVDLRADVLEALSDIEALPARAIRQRPPLAYLNVDLDTLDLVLQHLCKDGLVVRWYEAVEVPTSGGRARQDRQAVYRRVGGQLDRDQS